MVNRVNYYRCFSIPLLKFAKAHNKMYVSSFIHANGKTCWIFILDEDFSRILTAYSECRKYKQDITLEKSI